jgi:hypothetical protein
MEVVLGIAILIVLALVVGSWVWAVRHYHARWWITVPSGLLLVLVVLSFFRSG